MFITQAVKRTKNYDDSKIKCPKCGKGIQTQHLKNHLSQHERGLIKGNKVTPPKHKRKSKVKNKYKRRISLTPEQRRLKFEKEFGVKEKPKITLKPSSKFRTVDVSISSVKLYNGFLECTFDNKIFTYRDKSIQKEYSEILDLFAEKKGKALRIKLSEAKIEFSTEILGFINYLEEIFNSKYNRQCQVCHLWIKKNEFQDHKRDCKEITIDKKITEFKRKTRIAKTAITSSSVPVKPLLAISNKREGILEICNSIQKQRIHEDRCRFQTVGRLFAKDENGNNYIWWLYNDLKESHKEKKDVTGRVIEVEINPNHSKTYIGTKVSKNSKLVGDLLSSTKATAIMKNKLKVALKSKSNYGSSNPKKAKPISIQSRLSEKPILWNSVSDLVQTINKIIGTVRQLNNADIHKALMAKKNEASTIEELFKDAKPFIRDAIKLKNQDILEREQESVKRGNIFDGTTVVIDGGPGTGKTTSLIQRIRFLTSPIAIREYLPNISEAKFEQITNTASKNWIFYSPTQLLAKYLKENMIHEGLESNQDYIKVWNEERNRLIPDYNLSKVTVLNGEILDQNNIKEISDEFRLFYLDHLYKQFSDSTTYELRTPEFRTLQNRISSRRSELIKGIEDIITIQPIKRLFDALAYYYNNQENDNSIVAFQKSITSQLDEKVNLIIASLKPEEKKQYAVLISDKVRAEDDFDLDKNIVKELRATISSVAQRLLEKKVKLSKRKSFLAPFVEAQINEKLLISYKEISLLSNAYKIYKKPFSNFYLGQLITLYKEYRMTLIKDVKQSENDKDEWYEDEVSFYISMVNEAVIELLQKQSIQESNKYSLVTAYLERRKNIIAVDEASDLNLFDLKCIYSFRFHNPDLSSVTFCGDIMQRMTSDGVKAWDSLNEIIEGFKLAELKTSFRQSPTLLDLARKIFKEVTGRSAKYKPFLNSYKGEPRPLLYIDDKEENRIVWILNRMDEVLCDYGNNLPSTAIFVPRQEDVIPVCDLFEKYRQNKEYSYIPYNEKTDLLGVKNKVVIFSVDQIKGLEFEVVFFHDLQILENNLVDSDILLRYVYVGLSRAAYYFGMTAPAVFSNRLKFLNKVLIQHKKWS